MQVTLRVARFDPETDERSPANLAQVANSNVSSSLAPATAALGTSFMGT
jgi:hypothetical protein